ncbi:hypothetical protein LINGRAHAP2_LOCUS35267 [Linum grandiflorum]
MTRLECMSFHHLLRPGRLYSTCEVRSIGEGTAGRRAVVHWRCF